jgi:hypothetical protein
MRSIVAAAVLSLALAGCGDDSAAPAEGEDAGEGNDGGEDNGEADAGPGPSADDGDGGGTEPRCGNGVLNTDEICEGFDLRDATCESEGFSSGRLRCTDDCELDTSGCAMCGDGEISGDEVCEPDDVNGATCAGELGDGYRGEVECAPDCTSLVTVGCRPEIPAQSFRTCDPAADSPCSAPASCVETSAGNFCFETCDTTDRASCGSAEDFCYDYDGQGVCVEIPGPGEVCTSASGCSDARNKCIPAFDYAGGSEVSICAVGCTAMSIGTGSGCDAGHYCVPAPGGQTEVQSQTPCTSDQDCDGSMLYRCLSTSLDDSTPHLCARPITLCATPLPFFGFDGQSTLDSTCDLEHPSRGLELCGIGENAAGYVGPMATAVCYPLRSSTDRLGVCIGFCDPGILNSAEDGFCGDGFKCAEPTAPEFFLAATEASPTTCDPANPRCTTENPECLDIGRGPECARPAKMCIPQ